MACVLCIDSDPQVGEIVLRTLSPLGHRVHVASSIPAALEFAASGSPDLVAIDSELLLVAPQSLEQAIRVRGRLVPLVSLRHFNLPALPNHKYRFQPSATLTKPLRAEAIRFGIASLLEIDQLRAEGKKAARNAATLKFVRPIIGRSPAIRMTQDLIRRVAPTRTTVLLEGESGTGKELFARAIHSSSTRCDGPFITVNCAALPEGLVESSLFGHERGAFTGAHAAIQGAFEQAHHGTLLLDEVTETPLGVQAKLLRAIQEREITRVGGTQPIPVDVRMIATTNRVLEEEVKAGRFRQDLFYRLSVLPIRIPTLRERASDLPLLIEHIVDRQAQDMGILPPEVEADAIAWLQQLPWPGNIRELENVVERAVILARRRKITPQLLSSLVGRPRGETAEEPEGAESGKLVSSELAGDLTSDTIHLRTLEQMAIKRALQSTGGHQRRAAELLGITDRTLRNKLRTYKLSTK